MPQKITQPLTQKRPRAIEAERLEFTLSGRSGRALFVQIREHIHDLVTRGVLLPGMRLPPIRALARQLGINQITVAKAYRELGASKLIEGRRGGGSFVCAPTDPFALETQIDAAARPLLAERLFDLAHAPGVIAFTSNYPALDKTCVADFREALLNATDEKLDSCFHYDPPLGRPALRRQIGMYLKSQGIDADPDNILVTSGGQQAIDLAVRALVAPGESVVIEQPAYYGAINAMRGARARILTVPLQEDGMDLDALEKHLRRERIRLIYTNPTFQNPTGVTASREKRVRLIHLARNHGVTILEDDHSPEMRFKAAAVRAVRALAENDDLILYARGFGKVFLPGLRLGFLVVSDRLRHKLLTAKAHTDLHSDNFMQEAVAEFFARRTYPEFVNRMVGKYAYRQRRLYEALQAGMPDGALINQPEGGLSFWLTLPGAADVSELYFRAVRRGVAFVPGDVFYLSQPGSRSLRLSFGLNSDDELQVGVERLCAVVKDLLTRGGGRRHLFMT